jgi:hypothetical protein
MSIAAADMATVAVSSFFIVFSEGEESGNDADGHLRSAGLPRM